MMLCAKFGWNWPSGLDKDLISSKYFYSFYCLHLKKGVTLHLKKFDPLYQGCFLLSLVEISWLVLEKKDENVESLQRHRQTMNHQKSSRDLRSDELKWMLISSDITMMFTFQNTHFRCCIYTKYLGSILHCRCSKNKSLYYLVLFKNY